MKIAHVVWGMKTGGVETMLVNIINEQVKSEKVRLFIVNDFIDEFVIEKISPLCKIIRVNRQPKQKDYLRIIKLNLLLWLFRPDVVHIHSKGISKTLTGHWKIVRTIHGINKTTDDYPKMSALYSISEAVADHARQLGYESIVIPNGIKTSDMKTKVRLPFDASIVKMVQVSRLYINAKGQDILLKALKELKEQGLNNFRLHLIGSGPSENQLRQLTEELGLSDCVIFEGVKPQEFIYEHLRDYDLFVQPSRYEGFGLTVAEAMAAKLPVLVSDIQGPMEVIGHGRYGMSFKSGDVNDLATKLKIILQGGYDYSLIEQAYCHVCEEYDVAKTARRYLEEYRNVIKRSN